MPSDPIAPRFIVADSACKDHHGHFLEYSRSVLQAAEKRGYEPVLLANADVIPELVLDKITIRGIFTQDWLVQRREPIGISNAYKFYKEFTDSLINLNASFQDIVLLPSVNFYEIDGIGLFMADAQVERIPYICLVLRDEVDSHPHLSEKLLHLRHWDWLERVIYFTDSELLAEQYFNRLGLRLYTLPIPVCHLQAQTNPLSLESDKRPLRFIFLGGGRSEKGFGLLAPALEQNLQLIHDGKVEVTIQSHLNPYDPNDALPLEQARRQLDHLALQIPGALSLIDKPLDSEQYHALIDSGDVVLLPYVAENYGQRTSGIFAEALAAGKVVVSSRWPWIEEQMRNYPCGILMQKNSPEALAMAMREVVSNYAKLRPNKGIVNSWAHHHSGDNFMSVLLKTIGETRQNPSSEAISRQLDRESLYRALLEEMVSEIAMLKERLNPDRGFITSPWIETLIQYSNLVRIRAPFLYKVLRSFFYWASFLLRRTNMKHKTPNKISRSLQK
jgi:glycosyltransferase involved in cell wall biosynthesis